MPSSLRSFWPLVFILIGVSELCAERPPSTRYMADVERYRFGSNPSPDNPAFYPIPQDEVTRETYFKCIDAFDPASIAKNPNRGMGGPPAFMPGLAKYVQTGDRVWSDACVAMLKAFHQ
ncbi:MAG: hypothetical protein GWQ08_20860 [Verrucomicrobiaceae bacterium]|nr:hypothetical protein [Verrucomicrobiaceae bacterium]